MKRAILILAFFFVSSVCYAGISWSGDVDPSDPTTWDSSTWGSIGKTGNGTLDITDGGAVSNGVGVIGSESGSTGAVTVDGAGSTWTNSDLVVGYEGDGTLNITNGGAVSSYDGWIGFSVGSTSAVTIDGAGSTWTNRDMLVVGYEGDGTLNITDGGLVSAVDDLIIDYTGNGDSFINMATGGKLAFFGDADNSIVDFLGFVQGTGAIRYWDSSIAGWADITGATYGTDYTLEYLTEGDLAGYTMLTVDAVPEPATMMLFGLGGVLLRRKA